MFASDCEGGGGGAGGGGGGCIIAGNGMIGTIPGGGIPFPIGTANIPMDVDVTVRKHTYRRVGNGNGMESSFEMP